MGERKVLNFYISPDFDASIIPRVKRDWDKLIEVRTMLPFSMRCNTCGEYMYRGKKFNSKKESVKGDDYLGIRKFRFYIKCSFCSAEISFKTDPKNSDYEMESGASRNFEVWRETDAAVEAAKDEREKEDEQDAMKSLENRTIDSKIEMDVLDALDEMKAINQRHEHVDTDQLLDSLRPESSSQVLANGLTVADEELVKSIKFKSSAFKGNLSDSDEESRPLTKPVINLAESVMNRIQKESQAAAAKSSIVVPTIIRKKRKQPSEAAGNSAGTESSSISANQSSKASKVVHASNLSVSSSSSSTSLPVSSTSTAGKISAAPVVASAAAKPGNGIPSSSSSSSSSGLSGLLMGYGDSDEDSQS